METKSYYMVELPYSAMFKTHSSVWIKYRGEDIGYDWWNYMPVQFESKDEAVKAISESKIYKDCDWRVVKTTIMNEVVDFKNS